MAGILSRVMGYTAPSEPTSVGLENNPAVIKETEYSFFIHLNDNQLAAVLSKYENNDFEIFLEGKLPGNDSLRPRIRQWLDSKGKFKSASLETKVPVGDSKEEYPDDICQMNFRALAMACDSMTSRIRIHIPLAKPDGMPYLKADGSQMGWELDLFYNPVFDGSINNWVKIELEVDAFTVKDLDIIKVIPIEYERLINSKSQDPEDRRIIGDLYSTGYNIATNRNANYEAVPMALGIGTEDFFSFSIPGNEDLGLKDIAIATVLAALFTALAKWISGKLGGGSGGSSGGSGGSSGGSAGNKQPAVVKMETAVTKAKAAKPAAVKAVPVAKAKAVEITRSAPTVKTRRTIDVAADTIAPLSQRTEEAIETGINAKNTDYRVLTRTAIRTIEELKGFDSFKSTWGEPGPCTLHLLMDEINPTSSYYDFLDIAGASTKLMRSIEGNDHGFQYASFMTRAGVLLKNGGLIERMCDPTIMREQLAVIHESLTEIVGKLPAYLDDVDAAVAGDALEVNEDLVKRVTEFHAYFTEENKPRSSYLFMTRDWQDEARVSFANREEMINSKADLEAFVAVGHTFDHVFDLEKLTVLVNELTDGHLLARRISNNLYDVAERMESKMDGNYAGTPELRKQLVRIFGRENVSKHFQLRNNITSWAHSVSYWVTDMVRVCNMTTRVCDAIRSGFERTTKAEEWLVRFQEDVAKITDEDIKAYEEKRYIVHG